MHQNLLAADSRDYEVLYQCLYKSNWLVNYVVIDYVFESNCVTQLEAKDITVHTDS